MVKGDGFRVFRGLTNLQTENETGHAYDEKQIIKHKVGLINLADTFSNIRQAYNAMGLSHDTFYRGKNAVKQISNNLPK